MIFISKNYLILLSFLAKLESVIKLNILLILYIKNRFQNNINNIFHFLNSKILAYSLIDISRQQFYILILKNHYY